MVKTNKNYSFGLQGLHLQTIENEASRPSKLSWIFDPFKRFCAEKACLSNSLLTSYALLFEWVYGYKNIMHTNGLNKRRTPSAGALYPIELFLLCNINGEWKLCYYSFEKHAFFLCKICDDAQLNPENPDPNTSYIFMVAAFWRTIQRYGVRGFRYCLLDAGFINRNIERIYMDQTGSNKLDLHIGNHELHDRLPLRKGEKVLYSLSLSNSFSIEEQPCLASHVKLCDYVHSGNTPCISTNMIRVEDAISKSFQFQQETFNIPFFNALELNRKTLLSYIENRCSVKEFSDHPLSDDDLIQLQNDFRTYAAHISQCYNIPVHLGCVINRTHTRQDEVEVIYYGDFIQRHFSSEHIANQVCVACQGQAIVRAASFSFVLFVIPEELSNWSHFRYTTSILCSSFICSDLYMSSLKYGIGTTTIGGFSERLLMGILQLNDILPLVVQAFGKAKVGHTKVDAVEYLKK